MIIMLTAASGVGKTTLAKELLRLSRRRLSNGKIRMLKSTTTRARRPTDLPGEYEIVSPEEFEKAARAEKFLKPFEYKGTYYGTKRTRIDKALASSDLYIAILILAGVHEFRHYAEAQGRADQLYPIFLDLKSEKERRHRLTQRHETDKKRAAKELVSLRSKVKRSNIPFFALDAMQPPEALAKQVLAHTRP